MQALMEGMLGLMRFDTPVNKDSDVKAFVAYFRSQWGGKLGDYL